MKNNKGFTIVELLVSFTLSMVLVIILFELIITLKDLYQTSVIKTEMLNRQYLMTNKIYGDLTEKTLTSITSCEGVEQCIELTFNDNITKRLLVNLEQGTIEYDDYIIKIDDQNATLQATISIEGFTSPTRTDRILSIDIPIYDSRYKNQNFGINIVYPYKSSEVNQAYN